ncbi:uncharacterized protein LAESUDRAFT_311851 [Laetiporus sulphureus 93-53]|uniref:Uncharacterized protein n=1 Tax=Laetiporus sulphureus 93-53 TaxID=1314785 RepID=A0A165D4T7_9APHY|nr:uncharacterized protein LAESUDRAFT_311851 [Laetiporus sulphureus 93-53]KZT04152.1 hypothetical protein LAESUDRAFT_311851 [Laetiporus sulphureus 93-53]
MCNAGHKSSAAKAAIEHVSGIVSDDSSPPVTPRSLLSGVPYTHERIDVKTGYADVTVAEQASLTSVDPRSFRSEIDPTDVDNAAETPSTDIERSAFSVITIRLHLGTPPLQQGGSEEKIEESRNIEAPREISPAGLQFYRELFAHWASPRRPTDQPIAKKPDTMNTLATMPKLPTVKKSAVARKPGMKLKRRPQWGAVDNIPIYVDKARAWREFIAAVWNELADEYDLRGAAVQPIQGEAMEDEVRARNHRGGDC